MLLLEKNTEGLKYGHLIDIINNIKGIDDECIKTVADNYILLPQQVHTINLVRWYGIYRNDGVYNKATYLTAIEKVNRIILIFRKYLKEAKEFCPPTKRI